MKLSFNKSLLLFTIIFCVVWVDSFIGTNDYANWWIENILTFVSVLALIVTYRYYRFTTCSYFFNNAVYVFACIWFKIYLCR